LKRTNTAIFFLAIIALSACTTTKRRGEVSGLKKFYHDVTAKYNGYFNANEIMEETFAQLDNQHQNNYQERLSIFPYLENDNPESLYPALDTAIKKVTVVVNLHRESHWTDDCYFLVGKARFLKQDYESAQTTFQYVINNFDPADMEADDRKKALASRNDERPTSAREAAKERKLTAKERKKERKRIEKERKKRIKQRKKERRRYNRALKKARRKGTPPPKRPGSDEEEEAPLPELNEEEQDENSDEEKEEKPKAEEPPKEDDPNYFMKHRPVFQEAKLWLAKTYIERDNHSAAKRLLNELIEDDKTFDDIRAEIAPVLAYLYLKEGDPELAIQPMEQAVELTKRRDGKARYAYILAQLHQSAGRSDRAYATFEDVLKYTNNYDMEFNARLSMAQNSWLSGRGTEQEAIANLEKMLKDEKNTEYSDQIYYALASIALKSGDRQKAIENLELSLDYGGRNRAQAAETNYTLAQLYLEVEDFVPAKQYLDAALQNMEESDPRYDEVENLSENLTDIAKNLETIALQDSLLRISRMSEEEKLEFAARLKQQREEERAAEAAKNADEDASAPSRAPAPALQKESEFFAYDERGVRQGKRDFQRKWGDRPLEDNWRRSNKQTFNTGDADSTVVALVNEEEAEDILAGVPETEAEIAVANIKLRDAFFNLGKLYRDRLGNNQKSVEALEELNRRYPAHNNELDSWYYLYLAHQDLNNTAKAREYAEKIISKYPASAYAKVIEDPNYIVEVQNEEQKLADYYDAAYADFQNGQYQRAYDKSVKAREMFGARNVLQPKFALLTAMSVGNLKGRNDYISALNEVVSKYPNTEEQKYAREILRLLGATSGRLPGNQQVEADQFEVNDRQVHSIIIALEDGSALNESRNAVSDYNQTYHSSERLRISDVYLINGEIRTPLIVVRRFKNKDEAMRYYNGIQKNIDDFIPSKYNYEVYAITQTNYGKLFATVKSIEAYKSFFELNYK